MPGRKGEARYYLLCGRYHPWCTVSLGSNSENSDAGILLSVTECLRCTHGDGGRSLGGIAQVAGGLGPPPPRGGFRGGGGAGAASGFLSVGGRGGGPRV